MRSLSSVDARFALAAALAFGAAATAPLACFFPSYTYDLPNGAGGSTSSSSTSTSSSGTGGTTSSSSGTTGGMTTTTTTTIPVCSERDCSNAACMSTFSCYPAVPGGWTGYFELYDDASASPGCGGEWPMSALLGNDGIQVPDATCTCKACSVSGQVCSPGGTTDTMKPPNVDEIVAGDVPCGGNPTCIGPLEVSPTWDGTCYAVDGFAGGQKTCGAGSDCTNGTGDCNVSVQAQPLKLTGGTCGSPTPVVKALPKVTWTNNAEACGSPTPGMGCNGGQSCLAKPQGAYVKGICIMQAGEQSCPAGFLDQHIVYDPSKTTEGRTCGACTCGAVSGGSCSATITVYTDNCLTPVVTLKPTTSQGDCKPITGNPQVAGRKAVYDPVTPGTCAATGGTPGGTATPGGATTFCCTQ